ncbi:hypothetical protein B6A14_04650 [Polynucleobacter hirudinilacicola]|uniref:Uncharacterized protein n=1 Tax=Polynucleobacter hirudinilacicola TaxID=1743166 RepID=A0A210RW12_9BURK|nr:hypothetical protein [Polynucleobacter hirudinilacicola]OWF65107.1 hypothetical protein B6A14_04650 [Polynucleobacter hirudinilacicola]
MLSSLVFITFMPLQVSPSGNSGVPLSRPLAVAAFVDGAKILGLPKFKLRDAKGNPYSPCKAMMQEPSAIVLQHAGMPMVSDITMRKAYIQSYVKR